jgi:sugar lactone lactonase YvrE
VTPVTEPVVHGEGPHWDAETGVLFFVDIDQQRVNKYDPATNKVTHAQFGESARTEILTSFLIQGGAWNAPVFYLLIQSLFQLQY